jgi:MFS family permease
VNFGPYRNVLAIPGMRGLSVVALLARIPVAAASVVLTLHVVLGLRLGYGPAGLVGGAATIGAAIGAPFLGRLVDRSGLRPMLVITVVADGVFWAAAPWLPYPALLVGAFIAGLLGLPVFSVVRQALAAMVPEERRRTAYSLDSMSVEMSYMIGPMLGVLVATTVSTRAAALLVGAGIVAAGSGLYALNPPVRGDGAAEAGRPPLREWLRPALVAVLLGTAASALVLAGTDVSLVATLQRAGQVSWVGVALAFWCLASLVGGFIYGALRRGLPPLALVAVLGALTIPLGLFGQRWWVLSLALIPAGMLCAPTLASLADAVAGLTPESLRGLVMGLHSSFLTAGLAFGAPLAGAVIDAHSPAWAFATAGVAGILLAGFARLLLLRRARADPAYAPASSAATSSAI